MSYAANPSFWPYSGLCPLPLLLLLTLPAVVEAQYSYPYYYTVNNARMNRIDRMFCAGSSRGEVE